MESLGRYRLVRLLARGGMGELWLATVDGVGGWRRHVALKRVLPHLEEDEDFVARFIDEARIAASLSHGNIVPVFDMDEADGELYLAMDYVDGWDLRRILKNLGSDGERMPDPIGFYVAAELCAGLGYAHDRLGDDGVPLRIVHRDVSPSNVLVSRSGDVRLVDFGIASARDRLGKTVTGQLRGKFAYMSPEQAAGRAVDRRSDIFAVGSLVFEMLTGVRPFEGEGDLDTLARVQRGDRPALGDLRPDLAPSVVAVVDRILAIDPAKRYQRAEDVQRALLALAYEAGGPVTSSDVASWIEERFGSDPVFEAQGRPGGATIDDILNAQLDGDLLTPGPITGSARHRGSGSKAPGGQGAGATISASGRIGVGMNAGHTVTRAELPSRRRSRRRWGWGLGLVATIASVMGLMWWMATGEIEVQTTPPGATVFIDGLEVGVSPLVVEGLRGGHEIRVTRSGYADGAREISVPRGRTVRVDEVLVASETVVEFHSVPAGATVTVSGRSFPAGNSVRVPIGEPIRVEMALDGHAPLAEDVVFFAEDTIFTRPLDPSPAEAIPGADRVEEGAETEAAPSGGAGSRDSGGVERRPRPGERPGLRRYRLEGVPAGAIVTVDGQPFSGGTIELASDGAPVEVRVTGRGMVPWVHVVDPREAGSGELRVEAVAAVAPAVLVIRFVEPPMVGAIEIDGEPRGMSDDIRESFELPAGPHRVRVVNEAAAKVFEAQVELSSGQETAVGVEWR